MPETTDRSLAGVAETLLITLYLRAMETHRPDALIKDEKALALVTQMDSDFSKIRQIKMDEEDKVSIILRNREFDRKVREFLERHPQAVVAHLGCGLDARFERVDNGRAEWYDLDLPEVIDLRRKFIRAEGGRYHLLACSAFDPAWLDTVAIQRPRPFLFLAEGVFMYFAEGQVRLLVSSLLERFPGAELIFDALSPYAVRMNNLRFSLSKYTARYHWGLRRGADLERWGNGISLLDSWFLFDHFEPRLARVWWIRRIPLLSHVMGIYHYRIGTSTG